MGITAKIIEHSVSPQGKELVTFELEYPRFIHGELMTHRVFSRNAASSRAIPVQRMIDQVRNNPVVPRHWGQNQAGMQAHQEVSPERREEAEAQWCRAARHAAYFAEQLHGLGIHKQIANRLLEPFQWMRTIVTATEWDNFFELRRHPDAEPHFQLLAEQMWQALVESTPTKRALGVALPAWHLPYITAEEREAAGMAMSGLEAGMMLAQISAARCARVSYLTHDGRRPDVTEDIKLFFRLAGSRPIHASPLEHQAIPAPTAAAASRNFRGWIQFRQLFEGGLTSGLAVAEHLMKENIEHA